MFSNPRVFFCKRHWGCSPVLQTSSDQVLGARRKDSQRSFAGGPTRQGENHLHRFLFYGNVGVPTFFPPEKVFLIRGFKKGPRMVNDPLIRPGKGGIVVVRLDSHHILGGRGVEDFFLARILL